MRLALRVMGALLMLIGIYVVFFRESAGSLTSSVLPASAEVGFGGDGFGEGLGPEPDSAAATESAVNDPSGATPSLPTATVTTQIDPFRSTTTAASTTNSSLEDAPDGVVWETDDCDLSFKGYGVEMKAWGDILLPYAAGFPTSDPGDPPNCAPNTDFGGAIVAAHLAYLDAVRPELIQEFAAVGAGRNRRLDEHPGPLDPNDLGYVCEPLGWQKHRDGSFLLYHLCGESSTKVTKVPLTAADGRWLIKYPSDGVLESWSAGAGEAYYPFAGGD